MSSSIIQCLDRSSPIADLLEMIERRAPQMMKQGGGAIVRSFERPIRHLQPQDVAEIGRLWEDGVAMKEIVTKTGWSMRTVWGVTRSLKPRPRANARA